MHKLPETIVQQNAALFKPNFAKSSGNQQFSKAEQKPLCFQSALQFFIIVNFVEIALQCKTYLCRAVSDGEKHIVPGPADLVGFHPGSLLGIIRIIAVYQVLTVEAQYRGGLVGAFFVDGMQQHDFP